MPFIQKTPRSEINAYINSAGVRIMQAILHNLQVIGEKVVNRARTTEEKGKDFTDRTGNLRSSIGYVLSVDGQIFSSSGFPAVMNGGEGSQKGKAFAESIAEKIPQGIALVVVAGLNYAVYVSNRGYDVIDSGEMLARELIPAMTKKLGL